MMRRMIFVMLPVIVHSGCMADGGDVSAEEVGTTEQAVELAEYSASLNTSSATISSTTAQIPISFAAGETMMIGTYGITGSVYSGNTFLRLRTLGGSDLTWNDDSCGTLGSKMSYTSAAANTYNVWAGCSGTSTCGTAIPNVVAISRRRGTYTFTASNTNNATVNTINKQYYFNGGEVLRASTCAGEATGASTSANPFLRLYKNVGGVYTEVANNDNASSTCSCGNASLIKYTVPTAGYYQVRAGCSLNTACSGTVAVYAE